MLEGHCIVSLRVLEFYVLKLSSKIPQGAISCETWHDDGSKHLTSLFMNFPLFLPSFSGWSIHSHVKPNEVEKLDACTYALLFTPLFWIRCATFILAMHSCWTGPLLVAYLIPFQVQYQFSLSLVRYEFFNQLFTKICLSPGQHICILQIEIHYLRFIYPSYFRADSEDNLLSREFCVNVPMETLVKLFNDLPDILNI